MTIPLETPPLTETADGRPRRVGVEIEFTNLSASAAAAAVCELFGGHPVPYGRHRFRIEDTRLGPFEVKLDTRYLHSDTPTPTDGAASGTEDFRAHLLGWIGDVAATVIPCEIVGPPLPLTLLPRMDDLVKALARLGAAGTDANFAYAFGLHLNPEAASLEPSYILRVLRAYLLLSDWLRAHIKVDLTRQLLNFADPFPSTYMIEVLDPDYAPSLPEMIDHYIAANPTRNRELDLLPLFAWLDPVRVRTALDDATIRARPTFHWRLPNARVGDPGWSVAAEWNRWVIVERLAEKVTDMEALADAYRHYYARLIPGDWAAEVDAWLHP